MNTNQFNVTKRRNSSLMQIAAAMALAISAQLTANLAYAGAGWGDNIDVTGQPMKVQTFYANSPTGLRPNVDPNALVPSVLDPVTGRCVSGCIDTGTAIRKFVDTLPSISTPNLAPSTNASTCVATGSTTANCNGQYLPLATPEKWVDPNGAVTNDDYYEIGIVEYTNQMHSDLFKPTRLRGYVQLSTVKTPGKQIPLFYPDGTPIYKWKKDPVTGVWAQSTEQVLAVDNPHYLGPVVLAVRGTPVRWKFTNYLPFGAMKGAELFIPVDKTITGAGETVGGLDGLPHQMLENRTAIHWHGGDAPWISDGTPHQWFAPAGEVAYYANGLGKGVAAQNVPDMEDPGPGSMTMYFPNEMSGRLMWYHEHVSGLTRLNAYVGVAAGYLLIDPVEWGLAGAGVLPAEQIPLVLQDKSFVPKDIAQQDAKWDTNHWGSEGDLWFPHVYETNQDPNSFDGTNPVGRWDWGPWFWPIFPAQYSLPSGNWGDVTTTPEAFMDTAMVNGTPYPTLTVDPKAYRLRMLNGANDRFLNLSFFQAIDSTGKLCDLNAPIGSLTHTNNPIAEASGVKCTEVKMVPAVPTAGFPPTWPTDGRFGGVPDPATAGPDFIHIGTEGGLMPHPALIPAHPIAYEMNRRSVTVLNILDRGLLLGGAERADVIVDFSQFAGKTLILYNDAPAPVPATDPRIDYFTGMQDFSGAGGTFGTLPGYGPNTRTFMQFVVRNTPPAQPFLPKAPGYMTTDAAAADPGVAPADAQKFTAFDVAMAAAYGATQPHPVIPQPEYNQAFGTNDAANLARIYTGSLTAPTFDFTSTGAKQPVRGVTLIGGGTGYRAAPIVEIRGGGIDLSPAGIAAGNRPAVVVADVDNTYIPAIPAGVNTPAVPAHIPTYKLTGLRLLDTGFGYTSAPVVIFTPTNGGVGAVASVQLTNTLSLPIKNKAIQELFEPVYGRMNATLGVELPFTNAIIQTTIPLNYIDPATEVINDGETQIWKITHNGVDSHPVHFHLLNVQVLNRIGWDGTVKPLQPYEYGWKETVQMHPLEDIVVAVRAKRTVVPFGQPKSQRLMDPTLPLGSRLGFTQVNVTNNVPMVVENVITNYDNEYVWHCHILGHEENDFMRPFILHPMVVTPDAPTNLSMQVAGVLTWNDPTPLGGSDAAGVPTAGAAFVNADPTSNPKNEIKFVIEKSSDGVNWTVAGNALANATSWTDPAYIDGTQYRVIANNCAFHVFATNTCTGDSAPSNVLAVSASVAAPTPLTVDIALNGLTANLNWTDNAINETAYLIEVATVSANGAVGAYTQLANFARTGTQTTGTGAMVYAATTVLGKHYRYRVRALNGTVSSLAIQFDVDLTAPLAPIAPTVSEVYLQLDAINSRINVSWLDNATDESGYVIEQSMDRGAWSPFLLLNTAIPGSATRANVWANVISGHAYSYRVASYKSNLWQRTNSTWLVSGELGVSLPTAPALPTTVIAANGLSATLSWTDKSNNEDSFVVQVSTDNGLTYTTAPNGTILRTGAAQSYAKDVAVSYNAVTLAGTSYKYRVKAVNWLGSSTAISFNVVTAPAAPTTIMSVLNYQAATGLRANVSWLDNSNNETSYVVESSTDAGVTFAQAAVLDRSGALGTTTGTRASVWVPVLAGQRYTFRVKAVRTNLGVTANSTYLTAVTALDTTLPAAPTGIAPVIAANGLSATLSWTDNANNETNYLIETSTNNGVTYGSPTTVTRTGAVVAQTGGVVGGSLVPAAVKVTVPGTKYTYRVTARNLAGSSAPITIVADLSPPATPLTPTAVSSVLNNTATIATVSWTDNSNNETGYRVEVSTAAGASAATPFGAFVAQPILDRTGNGTTTGTRVSLDVPVAPNNRYKFRVTAVNTRYGLTNYSNMLTSGVVDTRIPNAPTGLSATPSSVGGVTQVALSWTDNSAIETSYTVQRAVITGGVVGLYANLLPTIPRVGVETTGFGTVAFTDTTAALGSNYSYKVFASNANGDSAVSNLVTADMTLPVAPTIQSVTPELSGVAVRWLDNSANETGFLVEYSTTGVAPWTAVETTASNLLISHALITQPGVYTYRVSAINQWGVPAMSTTLSADLTQPLAPNLQPAILDATGVNLSWNAVVNASSYLVEVSTTGVNGTWSTGAATALTNVHLPIVASGIYNYRVTALTAVAAIKSAPSVEIVQVDLTSPAAPTVIQVPDLTGTGVDLSWAAVPGATGYLVEYSTTGAAPWTQVETTVALTSHANISVPGIYSYQVTALTPVTGINSVASNLVAVNLMTPATPTQLVARLVGTSVTPGVDLTWVDNATNESGYAIEVDYATGTPVRIATVAAGTGGQMTWHDADITQGTRHYSVIALTPVDLIKSLPSNIDTVIFNGLAPQELTSAFVQSIALNSVILNWTDPAGNNEGGYRIYRSDSVPTGEVLLAEVPVHTMNYTDTSAVAGISYTYRVTAVNPWGETVGMTAVANLAAPVAPSALTATILLDGNQVPLSYTVTWADNSTNESFFRVEYSCDGVDWTGIATLTCPNIPQPRTNSTIGSTAYTGLTTEGGLPYGVGLSQNGVQQVTGLYIRVYAENAVGVRSTPTAPILLAP